MVLVVVVKCRADKTSKEEEGSRVRWSGDEQESPPPPPRAEENNVEEIILKRIN